MALPAKISTMTVDCTAAFEVSQTRFLRKGSGVPKPNQKICQLVVLCVYGGRAHASSCGLPIKQGEEGFRASPRWDFRPSQSDAGGMAACSVILAAPVRSLVSCKPEVPSVTYQVAGSSSSRPNTYE